MNQDIFWPPAKDLARRFGVHITTARRWVRERNAPEAVIMLLSRDLGIFDPRWAGWTVRDGELISPENWCMGASEIRTIPIMRMQIEAHRAENVKLRAQLESGMQEQPEPGEWDLAQLVG